MESSIFTGDIETKFLFNKEIIKENSSLAHSVSPVPQRHRRDRLKKAHSMRWNAKRLSVHLGQMLRQGAIFARRYAPSPLYRPALIGLFLPVSLAGLVLLRAPDSPVERGKSVSTSQSTILQEMAFRHPIAAGSLMASHSYDMEGLYHHVAFDLDAVRQGHRLVPPLIFHTVPADFAAIAENAFRKQRFIQFMLPMVLMANETIVQDRARIEILAAQIQQGRQLSGDDLIWLTQIANRYGLRRPDFTALLERVDIIPPSLALAQAAQETGWGTSNLARNGNALFGQSSWGKDGWFEGATMKNYQIQAFETPYESVVAYMDNLNSHPAYAEYRALRKELRKKGEVPDGFQLAAMLWRYSELGNDYVFAVRDLITVNSLTDFDAARLDEEIRPRLILLASAADS